MNILDSRQILLAQLMEEQGTIQFGHAFSSLLAISFPGYATAGTKGFDKRWKWSADTHQQSGYGTR
jgi:hypothetical protein